MRSAVLIAIVLLGCNSILGLEKTVEIESDPPDDALVDDSACVPEDDGKDCTEDVCIDGVPRNPPIERGKGCAGGMCDGAGQCVTCFADADCGVMPPFQCTGVPRCIAGACTTGPAPRDTLCNGGADQCDGAGNCVDCTNSGGCDECCVCNLGVCVPA